jgi:uncharacterized protein YhdP
VGGIALAYELALARVPQHRARLERLVRAHTGLDVRFNELNLRWGWYGPEAVFHRVELGEPGRAEVLVRAPELIVGFDAWRSMQSGQLQAGRITFVAPDINLERRKEVTPEAGKPRGSDVDSENRTRLLQRWRGGRIEIEGGTLRLPDPAGSSDALTLQIRRASLRRSDDDWSASALVFLPERLGHTARVAAQMKGDLSRLKDLQGSLRFDGLSGPSRPSHANCPPRVTATYRSAWHLIMAGSRRPMDTCVRRMFRSAALPGSWLRARHCRMRA